MNIKRNIHNTISARTTPSQFLQVIIGPRQVGKTTTINDILNEAQERHLKVRIYSADGPIPPDSIWLENRWNEALGANCQILVIDEIQKIHQWNEVVKILWDKDRHKPWSVFLLGSAAINLQSGLTESLAGRFELIHVHHWFPSEHFRLNNSWGLVDYLKFGGYPSAVTLTHDSYRWQSFIRESIIEQVLSKDIGLARSIHKPALFRQVFQLACQYPAQIISYQKILGQLQEGGNASTVKHYLEILEQAYLVYTLQKFSTRATTTRGSSPKLIPACPALIHAFTDPIQIDSSTEWRGRVFESMVGSMLKQLPGDLYYWRENKLEVDFIYAYQNKLFAIEVKSGRRRSSTGLDSFCLKTGAKPVWIDTSNVSQLEDAILKNPQQMDQFFEQ